jgi:hypothetical protein
VNLQKQATRLKKASLEKSLATGTSEPDHAPQAHKGFFQATHPEAAITDKTSFPGQSNAKGRSILFARDLFKHHQSRISFSVR